MHCKWPIAFLLLAAAAGVPLSLYPQGASTGVIEGSVRDSRGAIPGATVIVRNLGTNKTQTVKTNRFGIYAFHNLMIGTYDVMAAKQGFETGVARTEVYLDSTSGLDFTLVLSSGSSGLPGQACKDEEGMVADYEKSLKDLVETVKKESLPDFDRAFHQKNVMTKITLLDSMVDGMISCLQKSASGPANQKEGADATKGKIQTYNKLKDQIKQDGDALKAARTGKEAKALIEKFAFTG